MLAVQVDYWRLQETIRHDKVTEQQTDRSLDIQQQDANTRRFAAEEQGRHNLVVEAQGWTSIAETGRHNRETEAIQRESNVIGWYNAESNRMNAQTNAAMIPIAWFNAETSRNTSEYNYEIGQRNATVNEMNANTNWLGVVNQGFHNQATTQVSQQRVDNEYQLGVMNVDISQQNANTNALNAESNRMNAETNKAELELKTFIETSREGREWVNTANNVISTQYEILGETKGGKHK